VTTAVPPPRSAVKHPSSWCWSTCWSSPARLVCGCHRSSVTVGRSLSITASGAPPFNARDYTLVQQYALLTMSMSTSIARLCSVLSVNVFIIQQEDVVDVCRRIGNETNDSFHAAATTMYTLAQKPRGVSAPFQGDRHASLEARHNPVNTRRDWSETPDRRVPLNIQHFGREIWPASLIVGSKISSCV